jgi:hypothetical protein
MMVANIHPSPRLVDPAHAVMPTGPGPKMMPSRMAPGPMAVRPARMSGNANVAEMMDAGNMPDVTKMTDMANMPDVTNMAAAMVAAPMAAVAR